MGSRRLTDEEILLAKQVYGDSIAYDEVRIYDEKYNIIQKSNTVVSPDGNIYYPSGHPYYSANFSEGNWIQKSNFIHEMGHVLQEQNGMKIILQRILDGGYYNYDSIFHGVPFHELRMEAQAEFLQDLFLKRNGQPINPNKAGGALENPDRSVGEYENVLPMDLPGSQSGINSLDNLDDPYIPVPALLPEWLPQAMASFANAERAASPLVIDVDGDGIELSGKDGPGAVYWDLDQDGFREASGWIAGGDGLLALDRNGNGAIDAQGELLGRWTRTGSRSCARSTPTPTAKSRLRIRI